MLIRLGIRGQPFGSILRNGQPRGSATTLVTYWLSSSSRIHSLNQGPFPRCTKILLLLIGSLGCSERLFQTMPQTAPHPSDRRFLKLLHWGRAAPAIEHPPSTTRGNGPRRDQYTPVKSLAGGRDPWGKEDDAHGSFDKLSDLGLPVRMSTISVYFDSR